MTSAIGPQTPAGQGILAHKYMQRGETWREVSNRVAGSISDDQGHYFGFRDILLDMRFIPGGRILASLGTTKHTTPYNCFVSGTMEDALTGYGRAGGLNPASIMGRLGEAARTLQMGGGIGYDFSPLRPRGDRVRSVDGRASGPVSYIQVYDAMGKTISSAGERRGAQMGILRVDHPDIEEFIHAKQDQTSLTYFNLSIAVTNEFMRAVEADTSFDLKFENRIYRTIQARVLWEQIMRSTWDWGDPGVVFIDTINEMNSLNYCETIAATNPCSEQPLPPFGACLLGSFNLVKYLKPLARPTKLEGRYWFDHAQLAADIPHVVRAMDNVVDVAKYPLPEQAKQAQITRRMGLGVMGVANAIESMGHEYGSEGFLANMGGILRLIKDTAYSASANLAREKGVFPLYDEFKYQKGRFFQGLSSGAQDLVKKHGLRNSHLTSIAPTGTTAFMCDNVSSGIEPVFAVSEVRNVIMPGGTEKMEVSDYGARVLGINPKTAMQVPPQTHVKVLAQAQEQVDSSISKTCNVPADTPWDAFKDLYFQAWKGGAKGCATFQMGGKKEGIRQEVADCSSGTCAA